MLDALDTLAELDRRLIWEVVVQVSHARLSIEEDGINLKAGRKLVRSLLPNTMSTYSFASLFIVLRLLCSVPSGQRRCSATTGVVDSKILDKKPNWSKMRSAFGHRISAAPLTDFTLSYFSKTTWSILASWRACDKLKPTMPAPTTIALNGLDVVSVSPILRFFGLIVAKCETIIGFWWLSGVDGRVTLKDGRVQNSWR